MAYAPVAKPSSTGRGGFRFTASYIVRDGKRKQHVVYLGHDAKAARAKAEVLRGLYRADRTLHEGKKVWGEAALAEALRRCAEIDGQSVVLAPKSEPVASGRLHEAMDSFLAAERLKWETAKISETYYRNEVEHLAAVRRYVPDCELAAVDRTMLEALAGIVAARPKSERTGRKLSVPRTINLLATFGRFFAWAGGAGKWTPFVGWETCFSRENVVLDADEEQARVNSLLDGEQAKGFTVKELGVLWRLATPWQKRLLLLGLCFGWGPTMIACFRSDMMVERDGRMFVRRLRTKTKVLGYWWVCPPLAKRLRKDVAAAVSDPEKLVYRTPRGHRLVRYLASGAKVDEVWPVWSELLERASAEGVRRLPFSSLRDTGGQMVKDLGGVRLAQVFMTHSRNTILEKHYTTRGGDTGVGTSDFKKLWKVQRRMYRALKPTFGTAGRAVKPQN